MLSQRVHKYTDCDKEGFIRSIFDPGQSSMMLYIVFVFIYICIYLFYVMISMVDVF